MIRHHIFTGNNAKSDQNMTPTANIMNYAELRKSLIRLSFPPALRGMVS